MCQSPSGLLIKHSHGDRVNFQFRSLQLQTALHSIIAIRESQVSCRHFKLGKHEELSQMDSSLITLKPYIA